MPPTPSRPTARQRQQAQQARAERARTAREAAQRAQRRRRRTAVGIAALAGALVIALVVAAVVSGRSDDAPVATPPGITEEGGVLLGDAGVEDSVVVYLDYQCPGCRAFEAATAPWLDAQREAGELTVEYRPIAILDSISDGYSTRAAAAAACVAGDPAADFAAFTSTVYDQQPAERGSGLPDEALVAAALGAGAGADVEACITGDTHEDWVAQTTEASREAGIPGTPAVVVNGELLETELLPTRADIEAALAS